MVLRPFPFEPTWYKDVIIYELHVKGFFDSNDDGYGDFPGLIQKLDYVQDLGVNCIWLLPFYPSPLRDDGYDIADYKGINPRYGVRKDFKQFIREAHRRGIRVITELVVNHTSDQHPWFQAARQAPPGSPKRDYYVWSDDPSKYSDARIIFTDSETSNWTWDPVAKAYYWHRFFHHQPDLNYDNPHVRKAILKLMNYWLDMGVDGLRLDAIPYLVERDGTSCENLAETHEVIKEWRANVDARYGDRLLLAEANQWPTDVRAYFGDGDECHMAYHFPIMPRIFMALHQEDRHPITEIMRQTPEIPESCQWAIFLRNHDELTLEMVTDEERDYMYQAYAADPKTRINVGIRRRLATLMDRSRRRIELLNNLLFSLPGTPIIYYGDEIGMGDNVSLGDRNGVRTPMQWSSDRNGGFSRTDFHNLYSPPIMDPVYGFQAINVEAQQRSSSSLLNWMKRIIAIRKRYRAFSRGTIRFLEPDNRKVLVFLREYEDELILVVSNLSRFSQPVTMDLSEYKGCIPVEMFGLVEFPEIGDLPYMLSLGPHSFYWFLLRENSLPVSVLAQPENMDEEMAEEPTEEDTAYKMKLKPTKDGWSSFFEGTPKKRLETEMIPAYLVKQRWYGGKAKNIERTRVKEWVEIIENHFFTLLEVEYDDETTDWYTFPLGFCHTDVDELLETLNTNAIVAQIELPDQERLVLYDALESEPFCQSIFQRMEKTKRAQIDGQGGRMVAYTTTAYGEMRGDTSVPLKIAKTNLEQSNSSIRFEDKFIFKLYRRLQFGVNPEREITHYLTDNTFFDNAPRLGGALEYETEEGQSITLGLLQGWVKNQGDGWEYSLDELRRYYERVSTHPHLLKRLEVPELPLSELTQQKIPDPIRDLLGIYLREVEVLGQRTAEMHLAMAGVTAHTPHESFTVDTLSSKDSDAWQSQLVKDAKETLKQVKRRYKKLPEDSHELLDALMDYADGLMGKFNALSKLPEPLPTIRVHGDYHLGQVLWVDGDFIILDFEGEPLKTLDERCQKQSPLKDVAGMLRSYAYAIYSSLYAYIHSQPEQFEQYLPWAKIAQIWISVAYLNAYLTTAEGAPFLPKDRAEIFQVLDAFVLDKAFYEIRYELNNRPEWMKIPLMSTFTYFHGDPTDL